LNQAEKYTVKIFDTFDKICANNYIGVKANYIKLGVRKLAVDNHLVFYTIQADFIVIVRVIHSSRDISQNGLDNSIA
jgi:plasmid stabilization system protein ParE